MRNETTCNVNTKSRPIKLAFKGPENGDKFNAGLHVPDPLLNLAWAVYLELFEIGEIGASPLHNLKLTEKVLVIDSVNILYDSTKLHCILSMQKCYHK